MALNFPCNPYLGQTYESNGVTWQWDGTAWTVAPAESTASYSPVFISPFPPSLPNAGDLWWNSNTGQLFLFYQDATCEQWVAAATSSVVAPEPTSDQIIAALLNSLPSYATIAAALGAGVPVGGLFKLNGATSVSDIRAVASYQ